MALSRPTHRAPASAPSFLLLALSVCLALGNFHLCSAFSNHPSGGRGGVRSSPRVQTRHATIGAPRWRRCPLKSPSSLTSDAARPRTEPPAFRRCGGGSTLTMALDPSDGAGTGANILASLTDTTGPLISSLFSYYGNVPLWQACGLNAVLFAALSSKLNKMLTPEGFAHSFALGTLLWSTLGWRGWTLCVVYLFLGQAVTKVKFAEKEEMGIAESRGGRRGPENVWGSALTGLICAACSVQGDTFLGISSDVYVLAYVASLATKLADTFASEIGKAYGKTTFLITTFERVEPGTEGAISAEGTAAALVGGFILSVYGLAVNLISWPGVLVSAVAAFLATNAESLIGATLQEKEGMSWMTNEVVNFINTLIGAAIAILGGKFILGM